jgi:toxin YoeB
VKVLFADGAWEDYVFWRRTEPQVATLIDGLIRDCLWSPFSGEGKPQPLLSGMRGWYSRRIKDDHRLVYRVTGIGQAACLEVAACRFYFGR